MPGFDVASARKAGYSEDDILNHLTETRKYDVAGAVKAGYSKGEIIQHLSSSAPAAGSTPAVSSTITDDSGNVISAGMQGMVSSAGDTLGKFATGVWNQVNPVEVVKGLGQAVMHPVDTAAGLWNAQGDLVLKAKQAFDAGDYVTAGRHALESLLPVIGPGMSAIGDKAGQPGKLPEALGEAVGFGVMNGIAPGKIASAAARGVKATILPRLVNPNPAEAAAAAFAAERGVPISAAVATGNEAVKHVQKAADVTLGGSIEAQRAAGRTQSALQRVGNELLDEVSPTAANPQQAGESLRGRVEQNVRDASKGARIAYGPWEELNSDPANIHRVWVADDPQTGKPVYHDMALPVPMQRVKAALKPIYDRYRYTLPEAEQRASTGFKALKNIVEGPDYKPAQAAELDLGMLKDEARGALMPELKDISQGMAAKALQELDGEIRKAARTAKRSTPSLPRGTQGALAAPAAAAAESSAPVTAQITRSADATVNVPGGPKYPVRYELRELDSLQPSHDPQTFQTNRRYAHRNDRDYTRTENQAKVVEGSTAAAFDPTELVNDASNGLTGPPVVDAQGNVIGGNGRTMILGRVYESNPKGAAAYKQALETKAAQFGLDPSQVSGMKRPVLVRVGEFADPQAAITDLNKSVTSGLRPEESAIASSRRVSPETLNDVGARLDSHGSNATIADILDGKSGTEILSKLIEDGAISASERPTLINGNILTKDGRAKVQAALVGRFFESAAQMDAIPDAIHSKLAKMSGPLAAVEGTPFALTDQVKDALSLIERARNAGSSLEDFIHQGGLFGHTEIPEATLQFAKHLERTPTKDLVAKARQYADDAQFANGGLNMFGDTPTPEGTFSEIFGGDVAPAAAVAEAEAPVSVPARAQNVTPPAKIQPPQVQGVPAGDEAVGSLMLGRRATVAKYQSADVLKQIAKEPVQAFDQATWSRDAGVNRLKQYAREAPDQMREIGRAYLEQLFDHATKPENAKPGSALNSWTNLGPETKRILFGSDAMIKNLDNFMLLVKKVAENPNPSGSGVQALVGAQGASLVISPIKGVAVQLAGWQLSKLLHSPKGAKLLTDGLKLSLVGSPDKARVAFITSQLLRMAGDKDKKK
jgi:hypothetical protein